MSEAAEQALAFVSGRRRTDLDTDAMLRLALTRAVEIVGEAASQVSDGGRSELPSVLWPQIVGMRNRLVHAYFDINRDIAETSTAGGSGVQPLAISRRVSAASRRASRDFASGWRTQAASNASFSVAAAIVAAALGGSSGWAAAAPANPSDAATASANRSAAFDN